MKTVIDFDALSMSGLVIGTTTGDIFLTCYEDRVLYGVEMEWPDIKKLELKKIEDLLQYILFVAKPPMLINNYELQEKSTHWLLKCYNLCKIGDLEGLFKHLSMDCLTAKMEISSAQFVYQFLRFLSYGLIMPFEWEGMVSVIDMENWTKNREWHMNWLKVIPDYKE